MQAPLFLASRSRSGTYKDFTLAITRLSLSFSRTAKTHRLVYTSRPHLLLGRVRLKKTKSTGGFYSQNGWDWLWSIGIGGDIGIRIDSLSHSWPHRRARLLHRDGWLPPGKEGSV